jgi:hypothetical protein
MEPIEPKESCLLPSKQVVAGSSPAAPTNIFNNLQLLTVMWMDGCVLRCGVGIVSPHRFCFPLSAFRNRCRCDRDVRHRFRKGPFRGEAGAGAKTTWGTSFPQQVVVQMPQGGGRQNDGGTEDACRAYQEGE